MAGPPSLGSHSNGMTETDHRESRQNARAAFSLFAEGFEELPADFLGEGAAFSHGSGRNCALAKFPGSRAAEEDAVGFSTHYDHRENRRMKSLPPRPQRCASEHTQQKAAAHCTETWVEMNHIRDEKESLKLICESVSLRIRIKTRIHGHNVLFFSFVFLSKVQTQGHNF